MTDTPSTPNAAAPQQPIKYAFHPLSNMFPRMSDEEFNALVEDIRVNGLRQPIVLYQGQILDGRHRYDAADAAKRDLTGKDFTEFKTMLGDTALKFVVSQNVKRRHLNESQRALIAAQLATFTHGGDRAKASIDALTQKQAAVLLNVSEPSVERASKVLKNGLPALVEAVKAGKLRVSAVEDFAKSDQQDRLIAECNGDVVEAVKKLPTKSKSKKKKTESAKDLKQQLDDFKQTWDGFNSYQKIAFVKTYSGEIEEILQGLEVQEEEAA